MSKKRDLCHMCGEPRTVCSGPHIYGCQERIISKLHEKLGDANAVIAKLPKYADTGEPILPDMTVFVPWGKGCAEARQAEMCIETLDVEDHFTPADAQECYFASAAAIEAAGQAAAKEEGK